MNNIDIDPTWKSAIAAVVGAFLVWVAGIIRKGIGSETRAPVWKRIEELDRKVTQMEMRISILESEHKNLYSIIEKLNEKLDSIPEHLDRKIDSMEKRIIRIFQRKQD